MPALNRLSVKVVRAKAARPSGPGSAMLLVGSGAVLAVLAVRSSLRSVVLDIVAPLPVVLELWCGSREVRTAPFRLVAMPAEHTRPIQSRSAVYSRDRPDVRDGL